MPSIFIRRVGGLKNASCASLRTRVQIPSIHLRRQAWSWKSNTEEAEMGSWDLLASQFILICKSQILVRNSKRNKQNK